MTRPLISVAIATYNGEKYLRKQLDSIFNQTYSNIEVVVVDDCSNDSTMSILNEYKKFPSLRIYQNEFNLGFIKNFEKAILLCKGDFISLSDQDDIWLPTKIEILFKEINDYSLVCSDSKLIDNEENIIANSFREYSGRLIPETNNFQYLMFGNFVTGCTVLFERNLISKALPFPEICPFHDWWLAINATQAKGLKYIPQTLVLYRQHNRNVAGAGKKINIFSFLVNITISKKNRYRSNRTRMELISHMLDNNMYKNLEERRFLCEALDYTKLLVGKRSSLKACIFSLKYHKILPQMNQKMILWSKIIYLFFLFLFAYFKGYLIFNKETKCA